MIYSILSMNLLTKNLLQYYGEMSKNGQSFQTEQLLQGIISDFSLPVVLQAIQLMCNDLPFTKEVFQRVTPQLQELNKRRDENVNGGETFVGREFYTKKIVDRVIHRRTYDPKIDVSIANLIILQGVKGIGKSAFTYYLARELAGKESKNQVVQTVHLSFSDYNAASYPNLESYIDTMLDEVYTSVPQILAREAEAFKGAESLYDLRTAFIKHGLLPVFLLDGLDHMSHDEVATIDRYLIEPLVVNSYGRTKDLSFVILASNQHHGNKNFNVRYHKDKEPIILKPLLKAETQLLMQDYFSKLDLTLFNEQPEQAELDLMSDKLGTYFFLLTSGHPGHIKELFSYFVDHCKQTKPDSLSSAIESCFITHKTVFVEYLKHITGQVIRNELSITPVEELGSLLISSYFPLRYFDHNVTSMPQTESLFNNYTESQIFTQRNHMSGTDLLHWVGGVYLYRLEPTVSSMLNSTLFLHQPSNFVKLHQGALTALSHTEPKKIIGNTVIEFVYHLAMVHLYSSSLTNAEAVLAQNTESTSLIKTDASETIFKQSIQDKNSFLHYCLSRFSLIHRKTISGAIRYDRELNILLGSSLTDWVCEQVEIAVKKG